MLGLSTRGRRLKVYDGMECFIPSLPMMSSAKPPSGTVWLCYLLPLSYAQLLEMGFRPAIQAILRYLPAPERRQTLMFSATMPPDVRQMVQMAMKAEHKFVDCIGEEESTHEHVAQFYTICDPAYLVRGIHRVHPVACKGRFLWQKEEGLRFASRSVNA